MDRADIKSFPVSADRKAKSVSMTSIVQMLGSASDALLAQANLHGQLATIEWQEEKERLARMFSAFLIGFSCFICLLIFAGVLVVSLTWNTQYQWPALLSLCCVYGLVAFLAFKRFIAAAKRADRFFAGTRAELAADFAMIKSKLP